MVEKNRPCRRVFLLINREEALIDQLALLAKCSCGTPRRATTTFSTAFAIISVVYCSANAKFAMPSLLYVDFSHYHDKYSISQGPPVVQILGAPLRATWHASVTVRTDAPNVPELLRIIFTYICRVSGYMCQLYSYEVRTKNCLWRHRPTVSRLCLDSPRVGDKRSQQASRSSSPSPSSPFSETG